MIASVVEMVLRDYPNARNSDKVCLIHVWEHCGLYLSEAQQDKLKSIASPETIRRTRQKIQEAGKYLADERVRKSRRLKSLVIQQNAPTIKPEKIDNLLNLDLEPIKPKKNYGY